MARTAARGRRCDPCRRPASSSYPTATGSLEDGMIRFADVTFTHAQSGRPVVSNVDLTIPEGDLALVIGRTGSGKSTLLNMVNGLVPRFTGGTLRGEVRVNGMDTHQRTSRPRGDRGDRRPEPTRGLHHRHGRGGLAYTMESLGFAPTPCAGALKRRSTCSDSHLCATGRWTPCPEASNNGWRSDRTHRGAGCAGPSTSRRAHSIRPARRRCWRPSPVWCTTWRSQS